MPHIDEMKDSRFFGKGDLDGKPMLCTVEGVSKQNVAKKDAPEEMKWVLHIKESEKPFVLNTTNRELVALAAGSKDTDDWEGKQIVIYHEPNISFGGKLVGGLRVRAPKGTKPEADEPY